MANRFHGATTLFSFLALVMAFLMLVNTPVLAQGPEKPEPSRPTEAPDDKEKLTDSDHNKIVDDLDERIRKAKDDDVLGVIVRFNHPPSETDFKAVRRQLGNFDVEYTYPSINGVSLRLSAKHIRSAAGLGEVQQVEYDATVTAALDTAKPWFGVSKAQADFGVTGNADGLPTYSKNDIVIAIVDTGIDAAHVDLDGGKVIGWKDIVGGRTSPYDDQGHGTHVASIAAGEGQGNPAYAGVAPGAALVGIKVLNSAGSGSLSQVLAGVQWAIDNRATYGIRVMNISLGYSSTSDGTDALSQMVNAAVASGIVTVVAAGNSGPASRTIGSPAAAASAITVGSMADPGQSGYYLSSFSSRGPTADGRVKPDIISPGQAITAAKSGTTGSYVTMSGTSMATPFAAGVVALMEDANPSISPASVKSILTSTAADWGPSGADSDYGAGRLDAYAAIKTSAGSATGTPPAGPGHQFLSGSLSGTGASSSFNLNITNAAYPVAVSLIMPTWSGVDFDVYMYSPAGTQVALSEGTTRQETIGYKPSTTGTYRLEVRSYAGAGSYFADISSGAMPADTVPPSAPSGLAVSVPVSNGHVLNLGWNPNAEPDMAGYNIYRGTASGGPYQKVNGALVNTNSYGDTGLTNGVTYFYTVTATDTSGNESARSGEVSGTPADNKAPAISAVLVTPSSTGATIAWNTDEPADSRVEYGTTSTLGLSVSNASMVNSHSLNLASLSPSTIYFYRVVSADAAGNLAASAVQTFATFAAPGSISGVVTDASTGLPVSGATVTDGTRSTTTNSAGSYTLPNVPAGTYSLTASRTGYTAASKSVTVVAGATATVNFALIAAPTTGTITGRVTSASTGTPIAGARVAAGIRTVFTDANGYYTLSNMTPGTYRVSASASGYKTRRQTVTVQAGAVVIVNFSLNRN